MSTTRQVTPRSVTSREVRWSFPVVPPRADPRTERRYAMCRAGNYPNGDRWIEDCLDPTCPDSGQNPDNQIK
jgi:hypothetical protein